eukprot:4571304-Pyramimonas_sp.AAC.1
MSGLIGVVTAKRRAVQSARRGRCICDGSPYAPEQITPPDLHSPFCVDPETAFQVFITCMPLARGALRLSTR